MMFNPISFWYLIGPLDTFPGLHLVNLRRLPRNVLKLGMFLMILCFSLFLVCLWRKKKEICFLNVCFSFQSLVVHHGSPEAKIIEPNESEKMQQESVSRRQMCGGDTKRGASLHQLINHHWVEFSPGYLIHISILSIEILHQSIWVVIHLKCE